MPHFGSWSSDESAKTAKDEVMIVEIVVAGKPVTQGSKRAVSKNYLRDTSNEATKNQPANRLTDWRNKISRAAEMDKALMPYATSLKPINLCCRFVFSRHPKQWLKSGGIRKGAPEIPAGDLDKLLRAVCDSLSGVVYKDDRQVISFNGSFKRFGGQHEMPGVTITAMEVPA